MGVSIKINTAIMTLAIVGAMSTSAKANEMINNMAFGEVNGNIIQQDDTQFGSRLVTEVGSISAERAYDNTAEGYVGGDVVQYATDDYQDLTVRVGAIAADEAQNNRAIGMVEGSIFQEAFGHTNEMEVSVGAIHDGDGSNPYGSIAYNNEAYGRVEGDVMQRSSWNGGSHIKARVGSISPR